jgi:hypothetical protein
MSPLAAGEASLAPTDGDLSHLANLRVEIDPDFGADPAHG